MNKDEIKKALECCSENTMNNCKNCPYYYIFNCNDTLCKDALTLITEQAEEIERLKDDYAKLQELFAQYQMASDKEIIAQKKEAEKRFENNMKAVLEIEKKQAKINVLNELKNRLVVYYPSVISEIDELIKEYEDDTL